ncbi:uncharacterized protein LOC119554031 [Drosophila subpulchrella]|uniref:uncharacterized protein LOC119554031 n=1 Tax=Drosophila subpulchrella TaxID=1486046 RepID=UPI0018A15A73|nr:uncharacterized protein LOC119554031 [Drosophila subpulchrella]
MDSMRQRQCEMCESAGDDSDTCCVIFYGVWSIVVGALSLISAIYSSVIIWGAMAALETTYAPLMVLFVLAIIYAIVSATYVFAGVFLIVGWSYQSKPIFMCGKILSYFFPIYTFLFIYTIVVHFVILPKICRYVQKTWH